MVQLVNTRPYWKQKECLDFFDIYSPVMRITSIRVLIVIAVLYTMKIHQMDVIDTYFNSDLTEEIYNLQDIKMACHASFTYTKSFMALSRWATYGTYVSIQFLQSNLALLILKPILVYTFIMLVIS